MKWDYRGRLAPGWEYRRSENGIWQLRQLGPKTGPLKTDWQDERSMHHEVRPWRPFEQTMAYDKDGNPDHDVLKGDEKFYANGHYLVFVRELQPLDPEDDMGYHLSMRTVENDHRHDWREMQRVKSEVLGPEWEAIELYPAESRVVDAANQYHLWALPYRIPLGFGGPLTKTPEEAAAIGAVQR